MNTQAELAYLKNRDPLRRILGRLGVYERVKASWIYDLYWSFADKRIVDDRLREIRFYRNLLEGFRSGDMIFDVGANVGYKVGMFLKMGATVVAAEPDELNQAILRQKFLSYHLRKRPLTIVGKAVSEESSVQKMWIDAPGSALNTLSSKWAETLRDDEDRFGRRMGFGQWKEVTATSIEALIAEHGVPFFIKIDVEGHELSVLRGMRQPVPYLSFEVNLPQFRTEGLECVQVLGRLAQDAQFNYSLDCRRGLARDGWFTKEEMSAVLASSPDPSLEVFWRTPLRFRSA
jgi:FkbM family methyltransferase